MAKQTDRTIDAVYPQCRSDQDWRDNTETILNSAVSKMLNRGPPPGFVGSFKKSGIVRSNDTELRKHGLTPYYRTRDFRKKIAQLYVPVVTSFAESANGRFPVFKIPKNAFDNILKQGSGSASSQHRPNKLKSTN